MQQLGDFPAFFHRQIFAGQPDKIGAQFVLIHIDLVFPSSMEWAIFSS